MRELGDQREPRPGRGQLQGAGHGAVGGAGHQHRAGPYTILSVNSLPLECTSAHWISRQASSDFLESRSKGFPKVLMSKLIYSKCSPINY